MGEERSRPGVAVLDGKLYAVGGRNDDEDALSSVERYDPATNAWEAVAPLAAARGFLDVAVLDGKLYAVGGYNDDDGSLSSVERYDPALRDAWEAVAPMRDGAGLSRRGGARGQAVCCGRLRLRRPPQLGGAVDDPAAGACRG